MFSTVILWFFNDFQWFSTVFPWIFNDDVQIQHFMDFSHSADAPPHPCQLVQPVALDAVGTVEVTVPTAVFKTMSDKPSK